MAGLLELAHRFEITEPLLTLFLVLARVTPLVTLLPFLGGRALSGVLRIAISLSVAVAIFPVAAGSPLQSQSAGLIMVLLFKEVLVGTCLGLLGAMAFHALAMAGQLVDQSRGATFSQVQDPTSGEGISPLASFQLQLGVVLFLLMGGHRAFLAAVAGSYEAIPLTELPLSPEGARAVALLFSQLVGGAIAAALMLAAPAISAIVLTDLAMALLGRTAPQIGTYFMALPIRAVVGLAMVLLSLSVVLGEVAVYLEQAIEYVRRGSDLLGP